jgi:AraC-like DNA-binding protein
VVDIAFGWGFNSMATFYRTFVSEFGGSPAVLRAAAQADGLHAAGNEPS